MKRYWLFAGDTYYPYGGMRDYINSFDSIDAAIEASNDHSDNMAELELVWYEVLDTESMKVVKEYGQPFCPVYRNSSVAMEGE